MTLKEAFRYQNFLSNMFELVLHNINQNTVCTITEEHLRSQANPDAADETVDKTFNRAFDCTVDQLIGFARFLIDEKLALSYAIADAKQIECLYLDANTFVNGSRRALQARLSDICRCKPDAIETTGQAYRFNVEGNQVPYSYKVVRHTELDFDKQRAKSLARSLAKEADDVSAAIDRYMTTVELKGFTPAFDPSDTLDDMISAYLDRISCDFAE